MDLFQDWADELTITRNVRPQSISLLQAENRMLCAIFLRELY